MYHWQHRGQTSIKRIKHDFLNFWQKWRILQRIKNENFKCQNFDWKRFIFDSLKRGRKPLFNILSGLRHRTEPITTYGENHWVTLNLF